MKEASIVPQVAVAQIGSRKDYQVPVALARNSMLHRLHTDFYLHGAWRASARTAAYVWNVNALRRAVGRQHLEIPSKKVVAYPSFALAYWWSFRRAKSPQASTLAYMVGGRRFCQCIVQHGFGACNAVYAFSSAAKEVFEEAKLRGKVCILDHETAPWLFEQDLVLAQERRYPNWRAPRDFDQSFALYAERQKQECGLADVIICPSAFAQRATISAGASSDKTIVVPMGVSGRFRTDREDQKRLGPLRILFVGNDWVRKGLADLAAAVRIVPQRSVAARAVGHFHMSKAAADAIGQTVELLGSVPRMEVPAQFQWADVLVLPTVSDTFGLVILEAMAAGVPVITTPNSGGPDIIREGVDGFVVPIHSPETIAARLNTLLAKPDLLRAMSHHARQRAAEFSVERYAMDLTLAIQKSIHKKRPSFLTECA